MKSDWHPFSSLEIQKLTQKPRPPTAKGPRTCPICGKDAVRSYYHELHQSGWSRAMGSSWFWCFRCKRYCHFSGELLSNDFTFDDPYASLSVEKFSELEKTDWYGRLDQLWDEGVLPQTFQLKIK